MRTAIRSAAVILAVALAGCSSEGTRKVTTVQKSYGDPLLDRWASNFEYEKGEDGTMRIVSDERSDFEGERSGEFDKQYARKEFATRERSKMPWWGSKEYERRAWDGGRTAADAGRQSRFSSRKAQEAGEASRWADDRYGTNDYPTDRAGEESGGRLEKRADAEVAGSRKTFPDPVIVGWEEQRKMSVEETKGLLGR